MDLHSEAQLAARRRLGKWSFVLSLFLIALPIRAIVARGGFDLVALGSLVAWILWIATLARLDSACSLPFTATAKVCGFVLAFPFFWADWGSALPGCGTVALSLCLAGFLLQRRGRYVSGGMLLGWSSVGIMALLATLPWLLGRCMLGRSRASCLVAAGCIFGVLMGCAAVEWLSPFRTIDAIDAGGYLPVLLAFERAAGLAPRDLLAAAGNLGSEDAWLFHGIFSATLLGGLFVLLQRRLRGESPVISGSEIGTVLVVSVLLAWSLPVWGFVLILPSAALAQEAWSQARDPRFKRVGRALWAIALLASTTFFIASLLGHESSSIVSWLPSLSALALLPLVSVPGFYPTSFGPEAMPEPECGG